jgi:cytohesin
MEEYPDAAETSEGERGLTPLAWAAEGGHVGVIRALLLHGGYAHSKDGEDKTALTRAIEAGHDEAATTLLGVADVDTSYIDPNSTTLLALASRHGMTRTVRRLLELGNTDPDAVDTSNRTSPSLACEQGHVETVRELLNSGRVSLTRSGGPEGLNPLFFAVQTDRSAVVDLLAQRDDFADFVRDPAYGVTVLSFACERGGLQTLKSVLAAEGVHPDMADPDGKTPLCWAAEMGREDIFEHLIDLKADVNLKTEAGWTPLHYAAMSGTTSMVETLLRIANANAMTVDGNTPLVMAALHNYGYDQGKANIDLLLPYDHVSLHEQVERGNVHNVRRLLDVGYNVDTRDMRGQTPLHWAVKSQRSNRLAMVTALLAAHPKPDLGIEDTEGLTPLRLALRKQHLDAMKVLLEDSRCPTRNITAKSWLQAYDPRDSSASVIKVQENTGEGTKVVCVSVKDLYEELGRFPNPAPSVLRRLL